MSIKENNKLIAEFMGWEVGLHSGREVEHCVQGQLETYKKVVGGSLSFQNMKYHKSWDWLMPVIEKIKYELYYNDDSPIFEEDFEEVSVCSSLIQQTILECEVDDLYKLVVQFIKWYNKLYDAEPLNPNGMKYFVKWSNFEESKRFNTFYEAMKHATEKEGFELLKQKYFTEHFYQGQSSNSDRRCIYCAQIPPGIGFTIYIETKKI